MRVNIEKQRKETERDRKEICFKDRDRQGEKKEAEIQNKLVERANYYK